MNYREGETQSMHAARINVFSERENGEYTPVRTCQAVVGRSVSIGREGDFPLGVDPPDAKVSRNAMTVAATPDGWWIDITNLNGADIHPWGQACTVLPAGGTLCWPRIAIKVR